MLSRTLLAKPVSARRQHASRPSAPGCQPTRSQVCHASAARSPDLGVCIPVQGPSCVLVSWDEHAPDEPAAWNNWLADELAQQLVGVKASTSRAEVVTNAVRSASVYRGRVRANKLDLELEIEGRHLKQPGGLPVRGSLRVVMKTEENKDQICLSPVVWDGANAADLSNQVLIDIEAAAEHPLESALAIRLNDLLWSVEQHSLDSLEEEA